MYYDQPITNGREHLTGHLAELAADEPYPGVTRRGFSTDQATVTAYTFAPRAVFPLHSHPQGQITLVQRGEVRFTVAGQVQRMSAGGWSVVPGGVEHGLEAAGGGAEILAIIVPARAHQDAYRVVDGGGAAA